MTSEILHGLGVVPTAGRAAFTFELPSGERRDMTLEPLAATAYARGLRSAVPRYVYGLPQRSRPLFVSKQSRDDWLTTLNGGRVVYLLYNSVMYRTFGLADRVTGLAKRRKVTRVIVDVRNNGGGERSNYPPLLRAVQSRWVNRPNGLVVLTSRETFSAATHFAVDVERTTQAILVGEPSGGSPNHYSDSDPVSLPVSGWTVAVPTICYQKARPGDPGLVLEPDVRVELTARDFFAGNDPVLAAAIALPR